MGYVKTPTSTRYTLPSDATYWVELRDRVTYGEVKTASKSAIRIGPNGQPELDNMVMTDNMLLAYLVGWNLDDENGQILPLTVDSLNQLAGEDADFISTKVQVSRAAQATDQKNS